MPSHRKRKRSSRKREGERQDPAFHFAETMVTAASALIPTSNAFTASQREDKAYNAAVHKLLIALMQGWCLAPGMFINPKKVLGKGKSGVVFRLGKRFVGKQLKTTPKESVMGRHIVSNPVREMMVQAQMASLQLTVPPIAFIQCSDNPTDFRNGLLVMQRLPAGMELEDFLIEMEKSRHGTKARFKRQLVDIQAQMVAAIIQMHASGCWHGDLHGCNIWLAFDATKASGFRVLLMDFGRSVFLPRKLMRRFGVYLDVATMQAQDNWQEWATEEMFAQIIAAGTGGATPKERRTGLGEARLMWFMDAHDDDLRTITPHNRRLSLSKSTERKWERFVDVVDERIGHLTAEQRRSMLVVRHGKMVLHAYAQ